jgi:mannan endo-1,4-beta-mannosidase
MRTCFSIERLGPLLVLLSTAALPACGANASSMAPATPASSGEDEPAPSARERLAPPTRIHHNGQDLYLSGFNIAWFDFAKDIGHGIDEARLRRAASDLAEAGGNTLRWWIHTDGSMTPEWGSIDGERRVVGPGAAFIANMRRALDIAAEYNVYIVPCLWSFDMLRDNDHRRPPVRDNYRLLSEDAVLESYIDNALEPMVRGLADHAALLAWELFNEPENMTEDWFKKDKAFYGGPVPTLERLQRTQAKMAAAIHRAAQAQGRVALVTTGSKSMGKYTSDAAGGKNLYRDDRMVAAADGDVLATLDFYEPHYYDNEGDNGAWSPFHHPASHWQVDKPIVIGEFHTLEPLNLLGEVIEPRDMCQRLADYGYAGGWPWQWNEHREPILVCLKGAGEGHPYEAARR